MTGAIAFSTATTGGDLNLDQRQKLLVLYPNRHRSILKDVSQKSNRKTEWVTLSRHAPLSDAQLLNALSLKENFLRGCRWGEQTKFAVLDIDRDSQIHNELGLARIKHSLASVGFDKPLLFESSNSGGWHLYLSFSAWANAIEVQQTLKTWLLAEGYEIRAGQLEIFPSNNGLRLPLQKGFKWLDEHAEIKINREALTTEQAIAYFLDALEESAHAWSLVKTKIERRLQELAVKVPPRAEEDDDGFSKFFTHAGMIQEVYDAGREYWLNGLTAPSQRHHATLCIGHYLWYGDEEAGVRAIPGVRQAEKRACIIEDWLRQNHNGQSRAILSGNWDEVSSDIRSACHWTPDRNVEQFNENYPLTERAIDRLTVLTKQTGRTWCPEDFEKGNIKREENAREKIREALHQLVEQGRRITIRGLEKLSGCHRVTIRRHSDIWAALRLPKGLGDLRVPRPTTSGFDFSVLVFLDQPVDEVVVEESLVENDLVSFLSFRKPVYQSFVDNLNQSFLLSDWKALPDLCMVFDSLRLKLFGATASNSTAMWFKTFSPSLTASLATGSNTRFREPMESVCSSYGLFPNLAVPYFGSFCISQTKFFSMRSSGRQSNCNCEKPGLFNSIKQLTKWSYQFHSRAP